MTLHIRVILLLILGLTTLYVVFGSDLLINRRRFLALPPNRRSEAIPYTAIVAAGLGLACAWFATEYLIFGTHPLPYPLRASPILIVVVILTIAAIKRVRSR